MKANEILRNRRIEVGLSQKYVADQTGIPQASLSRYERGIHSLCNENAKKLADFYKINYQFLTGEKRIYAKRKLEEQPIEVKVVDPDNELEKEAIKKVEEKLNKKTKVEYAKETLESMFDKIYKEEKEKVEKETLRRTFKRLKKEITY